MGTPNVIAFMNVDIAQKHALARLTERGSVLLDEEEA